MKKINQEIKKIKVVWSYSIFGDDFNKYYYQIFENILIAKEFGATIVISTTKDYEQILTSYFSKVLDQIELIVYANQAASKFPKILRFLVSERVPADYYFFKDSDSVVTNKEIEIMRNWMNLADSDAMIIRDHPLHIPPIMAGMFGVSADFAGFLAKSARVNFIESSLYFYSKYSYDQKWLANKIYPCVIKKARIYTSFFYYIGEKVTRIQRDLEDYEYIGAQIYRKRQNIPDNENIYLDKYGKDLLCIPYVRLLSLGRLSIFVATIFKFLNLK